MKLQQITEMAAKKICDRCGKTMAANHFWYKGGWRCKKSALADVQPQDGVADANQPPAATPTPRKAEKQPVAPKEPTVPVTKDQVTELIPEIEWNDVSDMQWSVEEIDGNVVATWSYPFMGVSAEEAFTNKARQVAFGNVRLRGIASKFPDSVVGMTLPTIETARQSDAERQEAGQPVVTPRERRLTGQLQLLGKR